jgi:hypothetical protein
VTAKPEIKLKPKTRKKETRKMAKTIEDQVNLEDAEDFKLPGDGVHNGNLAGVEFSPTKAGDREQFVVTVVLSDEDPDAPNLPMRLYVGWPVPADKDLMWGSRTAYGSKVKSLKDLMTAFGGPESGGLTKDSVLAFLLDRVGQPVKVKVKQEVRKDTDEMQANVRALLPA